RAGRRQGECRPARRVAAGKPGRRVRVPQVAARSGRVNHHHLIAGSKPVLNWIIDFSLRHRFAVIAAALLAAVFGAVSMFHLDIDAFPDTTPVQVQINTVAPALGPEEVEQQIPFPVEQVLSGLPRLEMLRSVSKFGLSQVVVTFEDGTDIYFARQVVNE